MGDYGFPGEIPNLIGGEWRGARGGEWFDNLSPHSGEVLCRVARSRAEDVADVEWDVRDRYGALPDEALYLIEVGGRYLVIGSADHGIHMLTELTKEQAEGSAT